MAATMKSKKARLSKSIMEMKFMKRTKEKVEKQQFQEEGEDYFGNQLPKRMKLESGIFIMEPSYVYCEQLIDGRVSFHGMNPEVEALMEDERKAKEIQSQPKEEADISEEQMADQWLSLRDKLKSHPKEEPSTFRSPRNINEPLRKKPKFLKPLD